MAGIGRWEAGLTNGDRLDPQIARTWEVENPATPTSPMPVTIVEEGYLRLVMYNS